MNFSQIAKKMSWVTSHSEFKAHPMNVSMRLLQWEWYRMKGEVALLPLYDFHLKARPCDGVGRLIFYFRDRADELLAFMKTYLKPGMVFVDVGANIGSHTVHGSRLVTDKGRVFSFEADPNTFALLEENAHLNHLSNATLYNVCVSDKPGAVAFNLDKNTARNSLMRQGTSQISLQARTLDDLLPPDVHVDFLKIDVEGADYLVLLGATRIFQTTPPRVVAIEATSHQREIRDFLQSYGYRLYSSDSTGSRFVECEWPVFNTYAIRESNVPELAAFSFQVL